MLFLTVLLPVLGYLIGHTAGESYAHKRMLRHLSALEISLTALYQQFPVMCAISTIQQIRLRIVGADRAAEANKNAKKESVP